MSDLMFSLPDHDATEPAPSPTLRTLLAGGFAAVDCRQRRAMEELLAAPDGARMHRIMPGCGAGRDMDRAEIELAGGKVDLVLLDLDGSVHALLGMIERLRASACDNVVFIGIMPPTAEPPERLYLSSVMDAVVEGPLRPGSLHRALTEVLDDPELHDSSPHWIMAGSMTRH